MSHRNVDAEDDALFLRSIVENIPYMIFVKDARDLRFIRFNKTGEELLGYSRDELIGKNDYDFFPKEEADFFTRNDRSVLEGRKVVDIPEEPIQTKNHGLRYLHTMKIPILDDDGAPRYLLGISEDITERKQVQAELKRAKEEAEAASHAKTDFLARMSHEIRTPMNAVIGMTELALATRLSPRQREYLTLAMESAESLLTVLNDILDFSKIEAGKMVIESAPFDLRAQVEKTVKTFAVVVRRKGLELEAEFAKDLPDAVLGDAVRLRQVLVNLIDNAVRFADGGRVTVGVRVAEQSDDATVIQFSVTDTGIGIPEDQRAKIFEAFTQADESTTRRYGGTGLGLTISARLVAMMGGRIWLDEKAGPGSTFHFTIKLGACDADRLTAGVTAGVTAAPVLEPLRVLVVEDNPVNLLLTQRILEEEGHSVDTAQTGTQAIGAFKRGNIDLVMMDVEMPDMGGFEATRRIREIEKETGAHVPIIAVTAHALPGYREQCLEAGMDEYLAKPIRRRALMAAAAAVLPDRVVGAAKVPSGRGGSDDLFETFVESARRDLSEIEGALERDDLRRVGVIAHGFAGAAHVVGAATPGSLAQQLYDVATAGDRKAAAAALINLRDAVDGLKRR